MSEEQPKKTDRRWIANIKGYTGQHGPYQKALLNSISVNKDDGTPDQYYAGALIWSDAKTGLMYQVKQFAIRTTKNGKTQLTIDLENDFEVTPLK